MLFPPIDPNGRFRDRREAARRRRRLRRGGLVGVLLLGVLLLGVGAKVVGRDTSVRPNPTATLLGAPAATAPSGRRSLPVEIRGVHVTMGLASLPGKLDEYLALEHDGLTAVELDVKDETGQIAFGSPSLALARKVGATRSFYDPRQVARKVHARGLYLIGRVVVFDDPILASGRPDLAVRRADGSAWKDSAGLGWTSPYDRRVWRYDVDVAMAAARAGFDEILFDYVRFPSDGDIGGIVYSNPSKLGKRDAVPAFLHYARSRLVRLGVRMSAAVFGLSATRDLGIGQLPGRMAPYLDEVYPMTYPSLFGSGELGLADPSSTPGATVSRALARFRHALRGRSTLVVPWVQDWTFSRPYGLDEVRAQVEAARLAGAKGFVLWNARGVYTDGALSADSG
jgi:hypothetical protein